MHVIALRFEASPTSNDDQVRPIVDGDDLLSILWEDSLGIDPPEFFRQPPLGSAGTLLIGRCSCGVISCGDVRADVESGESFVIWQFGADREYRFDLQQYLRCFELASQDTTWESLGRTAERLVSSLNFENLRDHGYQFNWASTRIARGLVSLSFSKEGTQRLFEVAWNARQAEDAEQQVRRWLAEYA